MRRTWVLLSFIVLWGVNGIGCIDQRESTTSTGAGEAALLQDATHGRAVPGFFFLRPLVKQGRDQTFGTFAATADPTVVIDQISPEGVSSSSPVILKSNVAVFTATSGPLLVNRAGKKRTEHVRVHLANRPCDADDDDTDNDDQAYFVVRWDTVEAKLPEGGVYRIHVRAPVRGAARELGLADVLLVKKGQKVRVIDTGTDVSLVNGRILRIKFRIDTAALDPCLGVVCAAADACHGAGTCDSRTGLCSNPAKPDGTSCDDHNACTRTDSCRAGVCEGSQPITCVAQDACHVAGICNPATGTCSTPPADPAACSAGDGGAGSVGVNGGTITTGLADVTVPQLATISALDISVQAVPTPAALPTGVRAVGPAVDVELGSGQAEKLNAPVIVKLKYVPSLVQDRSKLAVLHFDGTMYEPTTILADDPVSNTISIETRTFSPFQIVDFSGFLLPDTANVGFAPTRDGWNIQNFGSYFSPGGNCLGMAGYATWYFGHRTPGLNGHFSTAGAPSVATLLATRAHLAQSQYWALKSSELFAALGPERTATLMKFYLAAFTEPLILLLEPAPGEPRHASVVYGYGAGNFTFYDVNFPNAVQTITWDGTAWGPYQSYRNFSFVAAPSLGRTEDFAALTAEAEGGFTSSSALSVAAPVPGSAIPQDHTTLSGTLTGLAAGTQVIAYVKGVRQTLAVNGSAFSGEIPIASGENTIAVLAGVNILNQSNWYRNGATRVFSVTGSQAATRLLVTLTWDQGSSDVDLYGIDSNGNTAWYASKSTASGLMLDFDNTSGFGPEHTTLTLTGNAAVIPGDYLVRVHYYADHSGLSTPQPITGTVTIVVNEGLPNQRLATFRFGVNVASSSNASPGRTGADWVDIARVDIVNGRITAL